MTDYYQTKYLKYKFYNLLNQYGGYTGLRVAPQ